jgi:hypothetical protein
MDTVSTATSGPVLESADLIWLDGLKPSLVSRAVAFLERNSIHSPKNPGGRQPIVTGSQIRNLLAAAQSGSPFAILVNFLRYQIGRGTRGWADAPSGEALALILAPEKGSEPAAGKDGNEEGRSLAALCAVQAGNRGRLMLYLLEAQVAAQFLGFLIREYTYRCKLAGTSAT